MIIAKNLEYPIVLSCAFANVKQHSSAGRFHENSQRKLFDLLVTGRCRVYTNIREAKIMKQCFTLKLLSEKPYSGDIPNRHIIAAIAESELK
jgi:hypothetical protein